MTPHHITLEQLITLRLLCAKTDGESKTNVSKTLAPFFLHRLSASAWRDRFEQTLASAQQKTLIEPRGKTKIQLTDAGLHQNEALLGYRPSTTQWQSLKNIDLIAYVLGRAKPSPPERKRLSLVDGLRGTLIQQHYTLPIPLYPTLTQARDALLWREVFNPKHAEQRTHQAQQKIGSRYTLSPLMAIIFSGLLGTDDILEPKNAVNQLVAKIVGAQRTDANELRLALLRHALADTTPMTFQLSVFVEQVKAALLTCQTGHFGEDKIFIAHVYAHMVAHHALTLNLDQFKQHLADANNQRLLALAQADLVPAMDPKDVLDSEVHYLTSVFHFIRR